MNKFFLQLNFIWVLSLVSASVLLGQVTVEGSVSNIQHKNILVSVYSEGSHQLVPVGADGKFLAQLPRFEECLVSVYSANTQAKTYSINTDQTASEPIKLFVSMAGEKPNQNNIQINGPEKRYVTDGYAYKTESFNLDNVKDKVNFASIMSQLSSDLRAFYLHKKLPEEQIGITTNTNEATIRKSEHKLGQEIFNLLNKKRAQEKFLKEITATYSQDNSSGLVRCQLEYKLLKAEATYAKTSYDLAMRTYEKEKIIVRRAENNNRTPSTRKMLEAESKMKKLEKEKDIAAITLTNKQADCWEIDAQQQLDAELEKGETADMAFVKIKRLEINNVRMTSRLQNAKKLYKQHNLLANDLTGRDRVVELANAQKYISQQEEIKLYQSENRLASWKLKNETDKRYNKQVKLAQEAFLKQREIAFQAEMAYLEHMWHLRDTPSVKGVLDDVFARQNDLLDVVQTNRPELEEPEIEEETRTDAELLSNIKIESNTRDDSRSKKLTFKQDYYEIIENDKGRKYFKNGNPITKLTYEFETKRKFGEILENVKEEERRKRLWDLFKKRIQ